MIVAPINCKFDYCGKKEISVKSFVLRVDQEMMEAIEKWAADEFRSTNAQIQYLLDQAFRKAG